MGKSRSRREFRKHLENQITLQSIPEFLPIYGGGGGGGYLVRKREMTLFGQLTSTIG